MRSLNEALLKPLKYAYNSSAYKWMVADQGKRIRFCVMAEIFESAYDRSTTTKRQLMGLEHWFSNWEARTILRGGASVSHNISL